MRDEKNDWRGGLRNAIYTLIVSLISPTFFRDKYIAGLNLPLVNIVSKLLLFQQFLSRISVLGNTFCTEIALPVTTHCRIYSTFNISVPRPEAGLPF